MPVYLANALLPEEEACNLSIKALALSQVKSSLNVAGHHVGGMLLKDFHSDIMNGRILHFYSPYNNLTWKLSNPGSIAYGQLWNEMTGQSNDAIYIIKPTDYDKKKEYPIVFFCHGFLGNWELYQGILPRLRNCIVVSISTRNLSGIFTRNDIKRIFTKYIPYLKETGYCIDESQIHLIRLSNGGTASDVALTSFPDRFKSVTYISTSCDVARHTKTKVILIGGDKDVSSAKLPAAEKSFRRCGTTCAMMFLKNENHFVLIHRTKDIIDFLNKETGLDKY